MLRVLLHGCSSQFFCMAVASGDALRGTRGLRGGRLVPLALLAQLAVVALLGGAAGAAGGAHGQLQAQAAGSKVIGGRDAQDGEFPYQVSLQRKQWGGDGSTHECGGAIVDALHVLTAAHCAHAPFPEEMLVVAGVRDITPPGDVHRINASVARKYLHPHYDFLYYFNDIALLRLEQPLPLGVNGAGGGGDVRVAPVILREEPAEAPASCVVSGWGNTRQGANYTYPSTLQALDLPFVDYALCEELYEDYPRGFFTPGMLCAGYMDGERDSCDGDSGGPLVCGGLLTGLVSWGEGCASPGFPGVYADVAFFREWIEETLRQSHAEAPRLHQQPPGGSTRGE